MKTPLISAAFLCMFAAVLPAKEVRVASFEDALNQYFQTVPLRKDKTSWVRYVEVSLNGEKGWMFVDSGAANTVFSREFAKKNRIRLTRKGSLVGIGGGKTPLYFGRLDSVLIGGVMNLSEGKFRFASLGRGRAFDFGDISGDSVGLFGYDVLSKVDLTVDIEKNRMLLPKKPVQDGIWGLFRQMGYKKVDLVGTSEGAYIPVRLGDKEGYFQVDTASSQTVLYDLFTKGKDYKYTEKKGGLKGVGSNKIAIRFADVTDFSMAGRKLSSPMLVVPSGRLAMIKGKPVMGILGLPIVEHYRMSFNFKRSAAYMPPRKKK